jgi:hypothetical protein
MHGTWVAVVLLLLMQLCLSTLQLEINTANTLMCIRADQLVLVEVQDVLSCQQSNPSMSQGVPLKATMFFFVA